MRSVEAISKIRQETVDSEPQLEDLIDLTAEIMLSPDGAEQIAAQRVFSGEAEYTTSNWFEQYKIKNSEKILNRRMPPVELKNIQVNRNTMQRIEKLGAAILEEAFTCLGERAIELLEMYENAAEDDLKTKVFVVNRVLDLIKDIDEQAKINFPEETNPDADEEDRENYPPIRISPRLIGKLPQPDIRPTCLGKSILAASFFYKAGIPVLHGGIVRSKKDVVLNNQGAAIVSILEQIDNSESPISPAFRDHLQEIITAHRASLNNHRGFHVAAYIKVKENRWIQLDPNYGCATMNRHGIAALDETWGKLREKRDQGTIGLENQTLIGDGLEAFVLPLIKALPDFRPDSDALEKLLVNANVDEMYKIILREVFYPFLPNITNEPHHNNTIREIHSDLYRLYGIISNNNSFQYMQGIVGDVIDYFFLSEEQTDLTKAFERFKSDPHYRKRRMADFQIMQQTLALKLQYHIIDTDKRDFGPGGTGHAIVDLGLPEYRVGVSAISDVAQYYGNELPLSTWISYWSSKVSLYEHIDQTPSEAQKQLRKAVASYALNGSGTLTNYPSVVILEEISESSL